MINSLLGDLTDSNFDFSDLEYDFKEKIKDIIISFRNQEDYEHWKTIKKVDETINERWR